MQHPKKKMVQAKARPHSKWLKMACYGLIGCVFALFLLVSQSVFKTYPMKNQVYMLSIQKGQNYSTFIEQLSDDGIVHFPWMLKIYQKLFIHKSMKAGVYEVPRGTSIRQLLVMLSDANNAAMNRIALIEGMTFAQLKQKLIADVNVKKTILNQSDAYILRAIDSEYLHPEGLFAPDTYFFAKGESDLNILKSLYKKQIQALNHAWEQRAANLPYQNKYDALIMASIVEKETALEQERAKVAGVFVRRLQQGMRLQTDPTVIYGMGENYHGNIRRQDLRTPTAYNTYTISGLPPTPIAMPSARSIEAALHPDDSNALYFVATGRGGHKFSDTLEQHNAAVQDYLAVLKQKQQGN